jgi:hypothetical protein
MKKYTILTILIVILLSVAFCVYTREKKIEVPNIPQPSLTYKNTTKEKIIVDTPYPDAVVGKEFSVIGQAAGWYFEGVFPIDVLDKDGKVLWQGPAIATKDWMTSELVTFKADVRLPQDYIGPATLILRKDNPSGDPQYDASASMPINIEY